MSNSKKNTRQIVLPSSFPDWRGWRQNNPNPNQHNKIENRTNKPIKLRFVCFFDLLLRLSGSFITFKQGHEFEIYTTSKVRSGHQIEIVMKMLGQHM